MAVDAFISYSSKDKITADMACAALESAGVRCWIAPRDIRAGTEYAEGIIAAIDSCRVMVLIFSSNANASPQIHREIERAVSKGLTIIPFRIEDIAPTKAMEYYLGAIHWLDALTPPPAKHLGHLAEQVKANLQVDAPGSATPVGVFETIVPNKAPPADRGKPARPPLQSITGSAAQLALVASIAILGIAVFLLWRPAPPAPPVDNSPARNGPIAPPPTIPEPTPRPAPVPVSPMEIRKSAAFGGNGGVAFDDTDWNENRQQISALAVIVNLNTGDTAQRIIGGLQAQWGDKIGPAHGGKGPLAQPSIVIKFDNGEKIGRVDVNSKSYHYPATPPPLWIAGLQIWTDTRVYTFGDVTPGPTDQCVLAYGEILLGFFGRSGSYIDQLGCVIGKAK